ncbi:MAG: hypothetical protein WBA93_24980 [Microcoleaceae cyanobacterium]
MSNNLFETFETMNKAASLNPQLLNIASKLYLQAPGKTSLLNNLLDTVETVGKTFTVNPKILETAYELYLQPNQSSHPLIEIKQVSPRTGASLLECRDTIVKANKAGEFPDCSLES